MGSSNHDATRTPDPNSATAQSDLIRISADQCSHSFARSCRVLRTASRDNSSAAQTNRFVRRHERTGTLRRVGASSGNHSRRVGLADGDDGTGTSLPSESKDSGAGGSSPTDRIELPETVDEPVGTVAPSADTAPGNAMKPG